LLDGSPLIELGDIMPTLDPPFFLMVRHDAPIKIKMKYGLGDWLKKDQTRLESRWSPKFAYRSSLEKLDTPVW
jgi:hypothetical protein